MGQLAPRDARKREMARRGYVGIGVGGVIVLIALLATSLVLGIVGLVVLAVAAGYTWLLRGV